MHQGVLTNDKTFLPSSHSDNADGLHRLSVFTAWCDKILHTQQINCSLRWRHPECAVRLCKLQLATRAINIGVGSENLPASIIISTLIVHTAQHAAQVQ